MLAELSFCQGPLDVIFNSNEKKPFEMFSGKILVTLMLFCQGFQEVFLRNVFVSHAGQDSASCGNSSTPCLSVRFAVNISNSGDVILIDHAHGKPYMECEGIKPSKCSVELNKSLSFMGVNGAAAVIQCRRSCDLFRVQDLKRIRIVFSRLVLTTSRIVIRCSKTNFEVVFKQCILKNYHTGIYTKSLIHCAIQTFNSSFEDSDKWGIWASCINLTAHFTATSFIASPVALQTTYASQRRWQKTTAKVFISNCVFDGRRKHFCAELLAIKPYAVIVNISVQSSRFGNHCGMCGDHRYSTFLVYDNSKRYQKVTLVTLNRLLIENNYISFSAVCLVPASTTNTKFKVALLNSIFRNNTGALFISMRTSKHILEGRGPTIQLSNNTFIKNFRGLGNRANYAVYFAKSRSRVTSCRFLNNMVDNNPYAAVVTVSELAIIKFENCYYENTQTNTKSIQLYAKTNSRLYFIGNNTFNIIALKTNHPIFIHMPSNLITPGVLMKGSLRILCPRGYDLTAKTQCTITKNYVDCFYLYSSCEQCAPRTYSLSRGELSNNVTRKIHCYNCPRGGQCERGQVMPKPNFWGYKKKERVSFLACPPEYCCDTGNCNSYDSCHGKRTGTMCGRCPEGMSEPLFNTKCKSSKECTSFTFWPGVSCLLVLYLTFFLYHEEITRFVGKSLSLKFRLILNIREGDVQNSSEQIGSQFRDNKDSNSSGFLKVIFYYYQIVHLLRNCVSSGGNQQTLGKLEKILSRLFNLIIVNMPSFDCPFQNLRPVQKAVILHSVGHCLLALLCLVYLMNKLFRVMQRLRRVNDLNQPTHLESFVAVSQTRTSTPFHVRIASAFTYTGLLMYSSSTQLCLSLLHCVPVGDSQVLFIDGTIKCYMTFQYFLLAYVVFAVLPFCLVPVLGSYLLKEGRISVFQFCIACIFPLPFCCFWIYLLIKSYFRRLECRYTPIEEDDNIGQVLSRKAILRILLGPFRSHKPVLCFPASFLPWEGFLIFRRLVLIIVLTFIHDNRLRMMLALIICVAILILHMYVNPFISSRENFLESLSLGTLIVLCGFTLVKALYQGEDFSSSSNSLSLLKVFNMVENILIITPLAIIIFVVVLSFSVRLATFFRSCVLICVRRSGRLCRGR